ncbi:NADH:flavin oxidoreductase/NADH oxidase [Hymenobacter roseosalivarius DSM 11622]|uniref:NADH:flavin oxidoreductase/NADH oxidase n=1 Tax=Hymenobacter roseosalivarius DSM 11622 TaxID=645990 RepID=A0A1W1UVA5_9BACT|nr:alkene reductase [Hymenobacter roseosalivarius]SMB85012.1 NADH:flavin oxidoreductase/NADH oxidase [Hymenobacter roseosalivarius DSM 11622]
MSSSTKQLFTPFQLGALSLPNHLIMAPMTRSRANNDGNVPTASTAEYYRQRASAGLIITEGSQVSPQGVGYVFTPGIHSAAQVAGWKKVTDAVHAAGGRIFIQLWHVGRISHPFFHNGELPVAPSAVKPTDVMAYTANGMEEIPAPRALESSEIAGVVNDFRQAAQNAKDAGFDGVEIHGANGYLLDQFIQDGTNQRTDEYGGSAENRARFVLEVVEAAAEVFGADRVGIRLSPTGNVGGISDVDRLGTFSYVTEQLNKLGLAYLHVIEALPGHSMAAKPGQEPVGPYLREIFDGPFILNGGYTQETAEAALENNEADLIAFGVPFIANPDLVERYEQGAALNTPDQATFYSGDDKGYIDYPSLEEAEATEASPKQDIVNY